MKRTEYSKEQLGKNRCLNLKKGFLPPKKHITQVCKGMLVLCKILEVLFCFLTFHMLVWVQMRARLTSLVPLGGCLCFAWRNLMTVELTASWQLVPSHSLEKSSVDQNSCLAYPNFLPIFYFQGHIIFIIIIPNNILMHIYFIVYIYIYS